MFILTDLYLEKCTIYNDISSENKRAFKRFVVEKCFSYGVVAEKIAIDVIRNIKNAKTVTTRDVKHYKSPTEFFSLAESERENFYTVQPGDFIVLDEVDDVVLNAQDFIDLQNKYKNNGIKVITINAYVKGMDTDNITVSNF